MARPSRRPAPRREFLWFFAAGVLPLPWVVAENFGGLGLPPEAVALLGGLAILGGAFLLTWSTELAERDIPQSLALLVLALVSVLPEYAVDLHFAWTAGKDPSYAPYAIANMTGANRLLIGLGWTVVVLIACQKDRTRELRIHPAQRLEIRFLLWATIYSFFIPFHHHLTLVDAAVLLALFGAYVATAMRGESHESELIGPPALVDREFGDPGRRLWAAVMFLYAAYAIFVSAEPFADGLVHIGAKRHVDEFLLVQWVAPLASESPEFVVAVLFALRRRGSIGIGALVSSKVNQWTLLVGALPIAFCASAGSLGGLPLDARQTEELLLTSVQSLLAGYLIADLHFSRREALLLAVLFLGQLAFPSTSVRYGFIVLYALIFVALLIGSPRRRRAFFRLLLPWGNRSD
jgi:cation:H+ antiporter